MDELYDPSLDRVDVAVRAVWRDVTQRDGALLAELGVEREVIDAVRELALPRPASEQSVLLLVREVPSVLDAAGVVLAAYYRRCGATRTQFEERLVALCEP